MEEEAEISDQNTAMSEQELDQQLSDEQNYRETIRRVRSFMGWHQVLEFESSASSQVLNMTTPLPVPGLSQLAKSLSSYLQMTGCVERWRNSTSLSLKATLPVVLITLMKLSNYAIFQDLEHLYHIEKISYEAILFSK